MAHIMGKLKVDATINGKDYKAGDTVYTQTQYGLEEYFVSVKKVDAPGEEIPVVENVEIPIEENITKEVK